MRAAPAICLCALLLSAPGLQGQVTPALDWQYLDLGTYIGTGGHAVGDFNQNGYPEVYLVSRAGQVGIIGAIHNGPF